MKLKTLIRGVVLFPGEIEKWFTINHDFIYIKSDDAIEIYRNRISTELNGGIPGLFQCGYGPFLIQNIGNQPVNIHGIKFTCGIKIQKNFFTTSFEQTPFVSLIQESGSFEVCCSDIIKVLEHIRSPQQQQIGRDRIDQRLIQLNRYIRHNYKSSVTLQDLADYVGVHPTYLSNTYSKVFMISPILFVNQLRMKEAEKLLIDPNIPIKDIANMVGYNSLSQFSLIFKRFHYKTPSEYRKDSLKSIH